MTQTEKRGSGLPEEPAAPGGPEKTIRESAEEPSGQALRMIYEDELRKACRGRALETKQEHEWLDIRKSLPINRWIERSRALKSGKADMKKLVKELESYLTTFSNEAEKSGQKLKMERNYYHEAIILLGKYPQGAEPAEQDEKRLTELMIMVVCKDAKLAMQILKSIA